MSYWDAGQRQLRETTVLGCWLQQICTEIVSSLPRGNCLPCLFSLYLKPLLCIYYCIGAPLPPPIFCQTQKVFCVIPKGWRCGIAKSQAAEEAWRYSSDTLSLAITWLYILLNKLTSKLLCFILNCTTEGWSLFLLCVSFKRKKRLSHCWGVPLALESTQGNVVQKEFSTWPVLKIKEADWWQGMNEWINKQMNEQTNNKLSWILHAKFCFTVSEKLCDCGSTLQCRLKFPLSDSKCSKAWG